MNGLPAGEQFGVGKPRFEMDFLTCELAVLDAALAVCRLQSVVGKCRRHGLGIWVLDIEGDEFGAKMSLEGDDMGQTLAAGKVGLRDVDARCEPGDGRVGQEQVDEVAVDVAVPADQASRSSLMGADEAITALAIAIRRRRRKRLNLDGQRRGPVGHTMDLNFGGHVRYPHSQRMVAANGNRRTTTELAYRYEVDSDRYRQEAVRVHRNQDGRRVGHAAHGITERLRRQDKRINPPPIVELTSHLFRTSQIGSICAPVGIAAAFTTTKFGVKNGLCLPILHISAQLELRPRQCGVRFALLLSSFFLPWPPNHQ
ncbi:hypothetical protein AZA_31803 [Nitrospirillum viridazoti Y2]|nr:hypothetical protein AZA_31803 [Nitrospirillum amazonense Y2]